MALIRPLGERDETRSWQILRSMDVLPHPDAIRDPSAQGRIPVIGIVGGVGSGKSSVARKFSELASAAIVDRLLHRITDEKPPARWADMESGESPVAQTPRERITG